MRAPRGFTLLEMVVVVAVLAVIAALSIPNLLPVLHIQQLESSGNTVAAFVGRARAEALARRRCVRVRLPSANVIVSEVLNSYDCEAPTAAIPELLIDSAKPLYVELARIELPASITAAFASTLPVNVPSGEKPAGEPDQIRFRGTGRLWSNDAVLTGDNDENAIILTHARVVAGNTKAVLVESPGTICLYKRGQALVGVAGNYTCP